MTKDSEFKDYLINDIPEEVHTAVKQAAKKERISMRLWIIDAMKEKLEVTDE